MIGRSIGHYEVTARLGEGGMGEVYRATDTRLGREVAIKVLPEAFVADEDRLARLEREARLLAQLSHPNVAAIHGLEEGGGARALVMELVEGPTLAERLQSGPLPLDESLEIARQIAAALEEAHERGIVHRDLKPQNVKAPVDGNVKVLDFGLAKALEPATDPASGGSPQVSASPTMTLGATIQGVILGTAGYMAPEQAKGMAVDKRADIWAFGVVLWEMLVGGRLFVADTVPDTLARVLMAEVDLDALPESTPSAIRRLVRRCLERQPKRRLRDIGDARLVIEEVQRGEVDASPAVYDEPVRRGPRRWIVASLLAAAALVGLGLGWLLRSEPEAPLLLPLALPIEASVASLEHPVLAISPDGRRHVLPVRDADGQNRLLLRDLGGSAERLLPETEGALAPFFSPDGSSLGFFRDGGLWVSPLSGSSAPIRVASVDPNPRGATWSRDGHLYFSPSVVESLLRVPAVGGPVERVTELDASRSERTHRWPEALPDGSAVIFTVDDISSTEYYDDARIEAVRVANGERVTLVEGASMARFLPPDRLLFVREGTLHAVAFDPKTLRVSGAPTPLVRQVQTEVSSGAAHLAVSQTGALLWLSGEAVHQEWDVAHLDAEGRPLAGSWPPPDRYQQLTVSPEGSRLALTVAAGDSVDLWIADLERETLSRRTFEGSVTDILWSPDGRQIAYGLEGGPSSTFVIAGRPGPRPLGIYWRPADGSGSEEALIEGSDGVLQWPGGFTSDGRQLVFERRAGNQSDLLTMSIGSDEPPRPLVETEESETLPDLSPDGSYIAYTEGVFGASRVLVRSFPDGEGLWQIAENAVEPRWAPDGRALYYRSYAGILFRVAIDTRDGVAAGPPLAIAEGVASSYEANTYDVARDGSLWILQSTELPTAQRRLFQWTHFRTEIERRERER